MPRASGVRIRSPVHPRSTGVRAKAGLIVLVALAVGAGVALAPTAAAHSPTGGTSENGPCPGPSEPSEFSGTLEVNGGPVAASSVADVNLTYSYWLQGAVQVGLSGPTTTICALTNGTVSTGSDGAFTFAISFPSLTCWQDTNPPYEEECASWTGPYGPVSIAANAPTPPGYEYSSEQSGSVFDLAWVADLSTISVSPSADPIAVAPGAPTTVVATPEAANGTLGPLVPTFRWGLDGSGWSFTEPPGANGSAVLVAPPGTEGGNLSVSANLTVGGNAFHTPTVAVDLAVTPTELVAGTVNVTTVDTGQPVGIHVAATGAPGYSYTATYSPGLGAQNVSTACASTPDSPTADSVRCTASVTYPQPGSTRISVTISNGYSSAPWTSANVTVEPAPALDWSPVAPAGYVGNRIPVTLSVAPGSGIPPYHSACFVAETVTECESTPGPNWTFLPIFSTAGSYSATVSVVDASGANTTAPVTVRVVRPLSVGPVAPGGSNVTVDTSVVLSANLTGGDLPAEVWWNVSGARAPIDAYPVDADGPISVEFSDASTGSVNVSVTVRDSLGTLGRSNLSLSVVLGPATSVAVAGPEGSAAIVVGTSVSLTWQALDPADAASTGFAEPAVLTVLGSSGSPALAWANVSGAGSLSAVPETTFVVPLGGWSGGRLSILLTPLSAGALTVTLTGAGILEHGVAIAISTEPDLDHLALIDPRVAIGGERTNATFWRVTDRYGNPAPGAPLVVQFLSAGVAIDRSVIAEALPGGGSGVWINYTLPGPGTSVRVLDLAGEILLGPVSWPMPATPSAAALSLTVLAGAGATGVAGAFLSAVPRRRARRVLVDDEENAARKLAEGRAAVVEILRSAGAASRRTVEELWDLPPAPPDLPEWIASLVADGTLSERRTDGDGIEYSLSPEPPVPGRVTVDPDAIDRAIARRDAAVRDDEPPSP